MNFYMLLVNSEEHRERQTNLTAPLPENATGFLWNRRAHNGPGARDLFEPEILMTHAFPGS